MHTSACLTLLGLSLSEAVIYETLLKNQELSITDLCQRTGYHRPAVYKHIHALIEHALVTKCAVGKRFVYRAESPYTLSSKVQELSEAMVSSLSTLTEVFQSTTTKPIVRTFEGRDGIKQVIADPVYTLPPQSEYYRYSTRKTAIDISSYQPRDYKKVRDKKQLQRYIIASKDRGDAYPKDINRIVKTLPSGYDEFHDNLHVTIYEDKVSFVDFSTETATVIQNASIAEFQKKIFKLLFKTLS